MTAIRVFSASVRAGVLAFGIGLAALAIPQLLDTAAAETTDAAPAAASTTDAARPASAARPAGSKVRVTRLAETRRAPAATPQTPARTAATNPAATNPSAAATPWTPLPARPRYRSPDSPAAAAPRPSEALLRGVDGSYVYFYNRTDKTLAVAQVPNGTRGGPEADPRYIAPGEKSDFYGSNQGTVGDVRLRIYTATQTDTGAWQKGEMKETIVAFNSWIGRPTVYVLLDPYPGRGDYFVNRQLKPPFDRSLFDDVGFKVGEAWFADYDLRGPIQSGQTGTYIERLSDRPDDYKVFAIEVFKIPFGPTEDFRSGADEKVGRVNQK